MKIMALSNLERHMIYNVMFSCLQVTVIEEAIDYIEELHKAIANRLGVTPGKLFCGHFMNVFESRSDVQTWKIFFLSSSIRIV